MEEHLPLLSPLLTLWEWGFESIDTTERGLRRMRTWCEAIILCTVIFDLLFYHEKGILKSEAKFVFWRQWKLISVQNPMCHMAKQKNGSVILGKLVRYLHFFFYYLSLSTQLAGSYFPDQGLNLCPQQWKCSVLNIGPPGNSLILFYFILLAKALMWRQVG